MSILEFVDVWFSLPRPGATSERRGAATDERCPLATVIKRHQGNEEAAPARVRVTVTTVLAALPDNAIRDSMIPTRPSISTVAFWVAPTLISRRVLPTSVVERLALRRPPPSICMVTATGGRLD
jgi:hypothetical protein